MLTDVHTAAFLCTLANRLPENVHVIVASRDRFLPFAAQVRLGGRLCQLGTAELRLNHAELAVYAHRCGTALSDAEISSLLYTSEGWFSVLRLSRMIFSVLVSTAETESSRIRMGASLSRARAMEMRCF